MPLQKQAVSINFQKGIDTKPDPNQLQLGEFLILQNSIFDKLGKMTKMPGFAAITSLPSPASFLTTFKNNLTAIGTTLQAYSQGSNTWTNSGTIQPIQLSTIPLIRNNVNQTQVDAVESVNGLVCTVYTETTGSAISYKFAVADSTTGQNVIIPTALSADATYGSPKVFALGNYFIIVYINHPSSYNLKYIAVNIVNLTVGSAQTISTSITPASTVNFDGVVYNNSLYLAWNGASASGIKATSLSSTLVLASIVNPDSSHVSTIMSVCVDSSVGAIWVTYYDSVTTNGWALAISSTGLATLLAATQIITTTVTLNIASAAQSGSNKVFYEVSNTYTYDGAINTNYVKTLSITQAGSVGSTTISARGVGLASKAFIISGNIYYLAIYFSSYQPTYFIMSGTSSSAAPIVVAKLAYSNGGGYLTSGLPCAMVDGTTVKIAYLYKDLVQAVNKDTNVPAGSQTAGIYAQTGINFASFNFTTNGLATAEIGNDLHLTGGFLWMYDGYIPVEHNFFLYPDYVESSSQPTTGGHLTAQIYFYQFVYRWTDNQGNVFRSAPSIPIKVDISGSGTSTNEIVLKVPTLRLTYKISNPVVIEGYRWSTAQQTYYQMTSISVPTMNDTTVDFVTITDTLADATILGNNLIYTTGGVLEDVNAPSFNALTLFDTKLWGIDAEDPNLLWPSKTVIEATPVEFSPEMTIYVAPNISEIQSTGPMKCLFPMDDKIIIFKQSSIFYINGTGPDSTGANSQYSEPTFIASPVGCTNPNSIVLIPEGLMFQSEKGIWLLGRNLSTRYIGSQAEDFNADPVLSVVAIPDSNRVVFKLTSGATLMYDYFVNQWGTFSGVPGISSTVYQGLETYMSAPITITPPSGMPYTTASQVFQETPGLHLVGGNPINMSYTTGWISMAGLQGFKRAYWMTLLGQYLSPHKITVGIAYDFNSSVIQQAIVSPDNYAGTWGDYATWGDGATWGGSSDVEQWQINFQQQTCQAFQITVTESYDATIGAPAGAGFTLSAMELIYGAKKTYARNIPAIHRTG